MLEVNGLQAWLAKPNGGERYSHIASAVSGNNARAELVHRRREEYEIHLRSTPGPVPFDAKFEVVVVDYTKTPNTGPCRVARIHKTAGWSQLRTSRDDLVSDYQNGLKFPYVPKHYKRRVVGFVSLVVKEEPSNQTVAQQRVADDMNFRKNGSRHFHNTQTVFTFDFIDKRCTDRDSTADSMSDDSDFHLPTSPNEGIPVTSKLRPMSLVRPVSHCVSATMLLSAGATVVEQRKRLVSQQSHSKTSGITARIDKTTANTRKASAGSSKKRPRYVSSSSSDLELVAGPSSSTIGRERMKPHSRPGTNVIRGSAAVTPEADELQDVTKELERKEQEKKRLQARLVLKRKKQLKLVDAAIAEIRRELNSD